MKNVQNKFSYKVCFKLKLSPIQKKRTTKTKMANPNQELKYTKLFINNRFVDAKSGKSFEAFNPATGKVLAKIAEGDKFDVDLAVEAARKAVHRGSPWRLLDASVRGQLLYRLAELFKRDLNVLANLETLDTGKPYLDAVREVNHSIDTLRYYAGYADKIHGKTYPSDGQELLTYTRKEPIGVVGLIATFDHPIVMFSHKVAPALAAGSTVVYKPSSRTPLSTLYAAQLTHEAGFPDGVFNVITGYGRTVGQAITSHDDIRHVTFSGRKDTGRNVLEFASRSNLKKVSLHLGGKNPLVVLNDANVDEAALIAHHAAFANQGQSATAGGRIYVQEELYDAFVKRSIDLARKRAVGNPFEKDVRHGPMIDEHYFNQVMTYVDAAKKEGAKLEHGGNRFGTTGYFIEPTIFSNVTDEMKIAKEEIFGPILVIMRFKTLDEIVDRANRSRYGLAAGVVTPNLYRAMYLTRRFDSGTIWINTWHEFVPQASFGGYKESGYGRTLGRDAIEQYLETKTISALFDASQYHKY